MHLHICEVSAVYFIVAVGISTLKIVARQCFYTENMHLNVRKIPSVYNSVAVCVSPKYLCRRIFRLGVGIGYRIRSIGFFRLARNYSFSGIDIERSRLCGVYVNYIISCISALGFYLKPYRIDSGFQRV